MLNALTIDLEDYWDVYSRDWLGIETEPTEAVLRNTEWFLETLEKFGAKATFFVLGGVAKAFPELVRKVAAAGHEIASHGTGHTQVFKLEEKGFRSDISESKKLLEDVISSQVIGYRAPAFSIMPATKWALEILAEVGFEYDSSVFPISGKRYGWPGFSEGICRIELPSGSGIVEVPLSTVSVLGRSVPVGGGGYMRHFPYGITSWALRRIQKRRPAIVYLHPYEIDTQFRQIDVEHLSLEDREKAVRHHKMQLRNRKTVRDKIVRLLSEFEFAPVRQVITNCESMDSCVIDSMN
jgi:polysaccharide deacetylase family protein (PEP-CTERM system associated)